MIEVSRHRRILVSITFLFAASVLGCRMQTQETVILNGDVSLWDFEEGTPVVFQNRVVGQVAEVEIDELEVCYLTISRNSGGAAFSPGVSRFDYSIDSLGRIVIARIGEE